MNTLIFIVLTVQALLGAFDNLWHHELQAKLPQRLSARRELALHAAREAMYGVLFLVVAWVEVRGLWAVALGAMLATELVITLVDFLEEDRTRKLPPFERLLHTVLTVCYGAFLALMLPVLVTWAQLPGELVWVSHGAWSWVFTAFAVGVLAWSVRNAWALIAHRPQPVVAASKAFVSMDRPRTVLVTGGTGFIGSALVEALVREGRRVFVLSRDVMQARGQFGDAVTVIDRLDILPAETRLDAIVHLAGARTLGLPWTAARRRTLLSSRADMTSSLLALMRRLHHRPQVLVAASAVGYYGVPDNGEESPACGESGLSKAGQFVSNLCVAVEHEARRAEVLGVRVVRPRFGLVLGRDGGAWPMQALAARFGLGAVLGSGRQPMPWVHLDDAIGLLMFALDNAEVRGAINVVAPEVSSQSRFAQVLAGTYGHRAWLRVPAAPLRWLGGEMMTLMLDGQAVVPTAALARGYRFRHPALREACAALAGKDAGIEAERPAFIGR
jgi:uncharacterized protein (TIGR01777 family)